MFVEKTADELHGKVYWKGILTQSMSLDLGGELLKEFNTCNTLTINMDGVELVDYSCLVLLCAVKRQAAVKKKELFLEGLGNPVVAAVVDRYRGMGSRLCREYCGRGCLFEDAV